MTDPKGGLERALTRREPFLVGAVITLAAVIRLPGLFGWWPNPDEGIYYGVVTREGFTAAWREALATSHPPLYFLILRGVGALSTDFAALRGVAFLSACMAVYVFVLLGRELGGGGTRARVSGLAAGLLLAVSPRAVVLSQVIRPYMLLLLLLGASLLFLLRHLEAPSRRRLIAFGICSLLAVLLHYASVFGLATIGIGALVQGVRKRLSRPEWIRLAAVLAVPALTFWALYWLHLRHVASGPLGDHALEGWLAPYMTRTPRDVWFGFVGFHSMLVGDAWAAPAAVFTATTLLYAGVRRAWVPAAVMAAAGLLLAISAASLQLYPFGPTRHSSWLLVFVIPLLACGLGALLTAGRSVLVRTTPAILLGLVGVRMLAPVLDPVERPREISEHVLRVEAVEAMGEVLDPGAGPSVALMSTETYEQLTPLYARERQAMDVSPGGELRHFRWGARDVVVLPSRDFATRPEQITQLNHLYTGALLAELEFGIRMPRDGEPVLVLTGGWRSEGLADLVELSRRVGPLGTTTAVPGLIALYLDLRAYGQALGAPEM